MRTSGARRWALIILTLGATGLGAAWYIGILPFGGHCQLTVGPRTDGVNGCSLTWCNYRGGSVGCGRRELNCGETYESCNGAFNCDCVACLVDAGTPSRSDQTIRSHERWNTSRSESRGVNYDYDGGFCSVVFNRYSNGCWVGSLEQRTPFWCHASVSHDLYPACGETVSACDDTFRCDCIDGGEPHP